MRFPLLAATTTFITVLVFGTATVQADGEKLFQTKGCIACHGVAGKQPITNVIPKLAGQNKDYLIQQAKDIKSGARDNERLAAMKAIVANVSDEDLAAIAAYLSEL